MAARAFLGAGDLYIARYNPTTQAFDNEEGPFECNKLEIKPNSDIKNKVSKGKVTYGQNIESVPIPKPSDVTIELSEVNNAGLTLALLGTSEVYNTGAGTMTNQAATADLDKYIDLGHKNIQEAGFLVKDGATGLITYTKDVDYIINYTLGTLKCLSTGAISAAEALKISGTYSATTGNLIRGATQTQVRARFRLDGINFVDSQPCIVDVHEAVLTPDSAMDFLADDFGNISLKGQAKTPAGKSEPYTVTLITA